MLSVATVAVALSSLCLCESARISGADVSRTSLFGYTVNGAAPVALAEAASALATLRARVDVAVKGAMADLVRRRLSGGTVTVGNRVTSGVPSVRVAVTAFEASTVKDAYRVIREWLIHCGCCVGFDASGALLITTAW